MPSFRALSWNLFHGRDHPPDRGLLTLRSKLTGRSERNHSHLQVNRDLFGEFASVLSATDWEVALLQECPPRWRDRLAERCEADHHRVLTSRYEVGWLRSLLAKPRPDLLGSWEGGSNLILVRHRTVLGGISARAQRRLRRWPERRRMGMVRLECGLCLANLHASVPSRGAASDVLEGARQALEWAGDAPLIFGGDLNSRPDDCPDLFARLEADLGLRGPAGAGSLDHLLTRGIEVLQAPEQWPAPRREVSQGGLAIRLSDHVPVTGRFAFGRNCDISES